MAKKSRSRQDFEELLENLLPSAQSSLRGKGEFVPFAAVMKLDGAVEVQRSRENDDDLPPCAEHVEDMKAGFHKDLDSYRATAVCYDVRLSLPDTRKKTDAINVDLDHVEGDSIRVCMPYKGNLEKGFEFGGLLAFEGEGGVFTPSS